MCFLYHNIKFNRFLHLFTLKKYINLNKNIKKKRFENDYIFREYNPRLEYKAALNIM